MDNRQQKVVESSSPSFPDLSNRWQTLNVWSRAAALGSLWAAFEIVVGSFLHNLRVPFTGMIMATASVFLLTAAAQVWDVKGLLWRAALVCALMKSVSPSAVLLGAMIGIIAEGVLLQFSLNLLGRGWLGCVVGGALAVSSTLLHKILVILTGERGEGKTTLCLSLAEEAKRLGWTVGGIASPGEWKDGRREGYWVRDLSSGEERKLVTRSSNVETRHVGSFTFSPEGFAFGRRALETAIKANVQLLIVDEIGPLELCGEGWAQELMHMQKNDAPCVMVWAVRPNLIDIVKKRFAPSVHTLTIRASETRVDDLIGEHLQVK